MKYYHLADLKTRLVMAVRFRPQPVRKSQYTLLIGTLFCALGLKQIRYFLSCSYRICFALPEERKSRNGFRNLLITGFPKHKASVFIERFP